MDIKVIKRDGSSEFFHPTKIEKVVKAAGLTEKQAKKLTQNVTLWVKSQGEKIITTREIRDKVVEELLKADKYAHDLYVWYEQTKDKNK